MSGSGPAMPDRPALTCDEVRDLAAPFVLGALSRQEEDAIRTHIASCADAHAEIGELASVLPVLDESVPRIEPPLALKGRILAAVAGDAGSSAPPVAPGLVAAPPADLPAERGRRRSSPSWVLAAAAAVVIAVLGGWNLYLQGQLSAARSYEESVAAVLDLAGAPGSVTAVLTAQEGDGPAGLAAVGASGDVALAMRDLPPTSGDEVYEAWVIGSDGVPVPLGGFRVGDQGIAFLEGSGPPAAAGAVLALTLEPHPSATTPTLPILSSGAATPSG